MSMLNLKQWSLEDRTRAYWNLSLTVRGRRPSRVTTGQAINELTDMKYFLTHKHDLLKRADALQQQLILGNRQPRRA